MLIHSISFISLSLFHLFSVAAAVATAAAEDMALLPTVEVATEAVVAMVLPAAEEATEVAAAVNTEVVAVVNTVEAAANTEAAVEVATNKEAQIWEQVSRILTFLFQIGACARGIQLLH
jgi:hypothetical protein